MRVRAVLAALAMASSVGACGGGDDDKKSSPATTLDSAAADRALAEQAVLRQSDFPPGWTSTPHEESAANVSLERRLAECLGADPAVLADSPSSVHAPDFQLDTTSQEVQNSVGALENRAEAQERLAVFGRPEATACLNTALSETVREGMANPEAGEQIPAGVTIGETSTERVPLPTVGNGTVGYRVVLPLQAVGQHGALYAEYVLAVKGRAEIRMSFLSLGSPFPADLAQSLLAAVVGRLPAG